MKITREQFKAATGAEPQDDDLDRCNCNQAGEVGHWFCGWDAERNMPVFWPKLSHERVGEIFSQMRRRQMH